MGAQMYGVGTRGARVIAAAMVASLATACGFSGVARTSAQSGPAGQGVAGQRQDGQGIGNKAPAVILAEARQALLGARSVHANGAFTHPDRGRIAVNLRIGNNAAYGKIKVEVKGTPVLVSLIRTRGKVYVRGRQLWQRVGGPAAAQRFGNRWVALRRPDSGPVDFTGIATLNGLGEALLPGGAVTANGQRKISGQPAVALKDGTGNMLYVAGTGKPYPVRWEAASPGRDALDLYEYNDPVRVSAPRGAATANL